MLPIDERKIVYQQIFHSKGIIINIDNNYLNASTIQTNKKKNLNMIPHALKLIFDWRRLKLVVYSWIKILITVLDRNC